MKWQVYHSFISVSLISSHLRLLKDNGTDGTYLIREGTHAGAEKIISVWNVDRCRHYKLHKDEVQF